MRKSGWIKIIFIVLITSVTLSRVTLSSNSVLSPEWIGVYDVKDKAGLLWIKSPEIAFYKVYRRRIDESSFSLLRETKDNRFIDDNIQPRIIYYYRLVGVSPGGEESSPSGEISYVLEPKVKEAIGAPRWEGYLITDKSIGLKWESFDPGLVAAYNIYRKTLPDGEEELIASSRENTFSDYTVEPGRQYRYRITALDGNFKETQASADLVVTFEYETEEEAEKEPIYTWVPKKSYPVKSFHGGGGKSPPFLSPTDVAVSEQGLLFVADSGNGLIQVFTSEGDYRYDFPVPPAGQDSRSNPLGLTVGPDGKVYCTDAYSGRILVFKARGNLVETVEFPREKPVKTVGLLDLCLNDNGEIFVVDNLNHRVAVFDAAHEFVKFFGAPGLAPGKFTCPTFCVMDAGGRLLITDSLGGRLKIYDDKGQLIKVFGRYGKNIGGFARPKGVALDSRGRIYIADSWLCQIQAFDEDGHFLFTLADEKGNPLDLGSPNGIFIDDQDKIYIAERLAHRVQIRYIQQ